MPRRVSPTTSAGCCAPCVRISLKRGRPERYSSIHSSANLPDRMSARISFMAARVSSPITRLPRVMSPYSAVLLME